VSVIKGSTVIVFQFPKNEAEWRKTAQEFKKRWHFDTCCGVIDGKRINIVKPANSGSYYYNYKGKFSIVMLATVNANYEFITEYSLHLEFHKHGRS
jgi:uncharacterized protein (UPF0128 family)